MLKKNFYIKNYSLVIIIILLFSIQQFSFSQVGAQVPLKPNKIPQFVDPLPHFAGIRVDATTGSGKMTVTAKATQQIAVSTGTKLATGTVTANGTIGLAHLWAYEISYDGRTAPAYWPAFTIETNRGFPLNVTYVNNLGGETYDKVGLIVDQTLHWANSNDLMMNDPARFNPYLGEPPITVHLHGGEVPPQSDGGPDSWFTPGNVKTGHAYNPSPYLYPNTQEAATLWFHDHALGVTRLNVYAGMAGFYFLRGGATEDALRLPGWSGDDLVQEAAGGFADGPYLPELEVVIQDRMFDTNGQLYFPNLIPTNPGTHPYWNPEFVGDVITVNGKTWPYLSVAPRKYRFRLLNGSNARFYELSFGNGANNPVITQIGTDGGFLDTPVPIVGKLVLAPGERADVIIDFTGLTGKSFILDNTARTPYPGGGTVNGKTTGRIMKFVVNGTMVTPVGGAGTDLSVIPTTPLKNNVKLTDFATPNTPLGPLGTVAKTRQLTLNEVMGAGGPLEVLVNNTKWSGESTEGVRPDFDAVENVYGNTEHGFTYYSETVNEGETEIWQIINMTADAHPIHLHLVQFQLMSRQPFNVAGYTAAYDALFPGSAALDPMTNLPYPAGVFIGGYGPPLDYKADQSNGAGIPIIGGNPDVTPYLIGAPLPANLNEQGWKDTYIMYPGEVTTVIARWTPTDAPLGSDPSTTGFAFNPNGGHGYVWHCHIIDHEDNEMMRPYNVNPNNARTAALGKAGTTIANASPKSFELGQNYPNPFNPSTVINFSVPEENALVTLKVYNSLGQEVGTLINQVVPAGNHQVNFDARGLSSGVYFYTLTTGNFVDSKKMVVMK